MSALAQKTANLPSGWTPHMKGWRMVDVSLRGVNFGLWSHLGCSGQNAGLHMKKYQYKNMYIVCVLTWSLLGVKKVCATPRSVSFRGLIQNFRRASPTLSYEGIPPETYPIYNKTLVRCVNLMEMS